MTQRWWMRGGGLAALYASASELRSRGPQSPLASRRLHTAAFCTPPGAMECLSALLLLLVLAASASPVLHGYDDGSSSADDHSTTTLHDAGDSTSGSATHSQSTSLEGEDAPPQDLNAVSGWGDDGIDDAVWKFVVSPPDTYERDEPPIAVGKSGAPVDEFTDDPNFDQSGGSVATWEQDTDPDRGNGSRSVEPAGAGGELGERTDPPARNASRLGPEVGSEEFEQSLGAALNETLQKMKQVLAQKDGGWQSALKHVRVKRSGEDSEEAKDLPVTSLNDIVDVFLIIARQSLEARGLDQVSIPPLERTFSRSLGVGTLRGFFRGDDGWVRRLTTVHRIGNVRLDRGQRPPEGEPWDLRSVSVATTLGLQELTVGFERYVADVRALPTVSGRLVADIDENAVLLNISFSKRDDDPKGCDVVLQELDVQQLEGINLKLTGLGPLNWLLSRIATWLTTHSQEKVAAVVEKELAKIANKELQNIPCDADFITAVSML